VSVAGVMRRVRTGLSNRRRGPLPAELVVPLTGLRGLEIGGPSACFDHDGVLPLYPRLGEVDGVQPHARTTWHDLDESAGYVVDGQRRGQLHVIDDIDMLSLPDASYDLVFCSHVIEHIANPLRALAAWRRVTVPGGWLLIVAPHMEGTFDHRRALTSIEHMREDRRRATSEDDLTHLDEFLELHDSDRNVRGVEDPEFVRELRENARTRLLHHHTFTTASLIALLEEAGIEAQVAEARLPHDIFVLGRWAADGDRPDNARLVASAVARSPFRRDRQALGAGSA
jgi:SAM-dependent methyltransferase